MTPTKEQEIIKLIDEKIGYFNQFYIPGYTSVMADVIITLKEIREKITGEGDATKSE